MSKKPLAIVLGGTSPHIALIENLKKRGYYTVLVDYFDNPPAKSSADKHVRESTLDQEKVLQIAREMDAKLVISACVDQANVTACYVAENLSLPVPYSYETALDVSNKALMKKKMIENGVPTSRYISVNDLSNIANIDLKFPVIVKPADCCGSAGVKKANNIIELETYLKNALGISRTNTAIVEEFKEGVEISAYIFIRNNNAQIIMISQRFSIIDGNEQVLKCYATLAPAEISPKAKEEIQRVANQIARVFKLDNTPLHLQALVDGDSINVIEFAPRVGGGVSYETIKMNAGFDIINATVDSYLGVQADVEFSEPKYFYAVNLIYAKPGTFKCVTGQRELFEKGIIENLFIYKTEGMEIGTSKASSARVGAFIVKAKMKDVLYNKIKTATNTLDVIDMNGESIMRKDIYLGAKL